MLARPTIDSPAHSFHVKSQLLFFLLLVAVSQKSNIFEFLAQQQSRLPTWYKVLTCLDLL